MYKVIAVTDEKTIKDKYVADDYECALKKFFTDNAGEKFIHIYVAKIKT